MKAKTILLLMMIRKISFEKIHFFIYVFTEFVDPLKSFLFLHDLHCLLLCIRFRWKHQCRVRLVCQKLIWCYMLSMTEITLCMSQIQWSQSSIACIGNTAFQTRKSKQYRWKYVASTKRDWLRWTRDGKNIVCFRRIDETRANPEANERFDARECGSRCARVPCTWNRT